MSGERFFRVSSERFAFRDSQSPAVSIVSGGVPESPPPGSFPQEECGSGFFGLSVIHPLGVIATSIEGTSVPRETWRDQLTIYPPSTRLGLGWAPTNPYWGVWVYTGSSWRSPSHHSVMAYRSRSCRASSERRLEHRASDLYAGSLVPLYLIIFRVKCSNSVLLPDISAEIFPLPTVTLCQQTMYTISNTHFFPSGEPMTVMDIYIPGEPKTAKRKIEK